MTQGWTPPRAAASDGDYHGYNLRRYEGSPPTLTEQVIDWIVANPGIEFDRDDVAAGTGLDAKAAGSVIGRLVTSGLRGGFRLHRLGRGRYVYDPGRAPITDPVSNPTGARSTKDLKPITDQIDDDAFKAVGLQPVAITADGDRICVDDQGTAWRVKVMIEARLI